MATMAAPAPNMSGLTWQQQEMLNSGSGSRPRRKAATGNSKQQTNSAAAVQGTEASTSVAPVDAVRKQAKARAGSTQTNSSSDNSAEWQTQKTKARGKAVPSTAKPANHAGIAASKPTQAKKSGAGKATKAQQDRGAFGKDGSGQEDGLTWQQREFNAIAKANADMYTNQKDAETFGGGSPSQMHRSAVSLGKPRNEGSARSSAGSTGSGKKGAKARVSEQAAVPIAPSTPDGKAAYAGPTFHNSPPASALPQPSFLSKRNKELNGSGAASSPLATSDVVQGHLPQGASFANRGPPGDASFPPM